jgi:hypothetical protein
VARKTGIREPNTTILLIVEGETEQIYFSQMKSFERLRTVTIKPKLAKYSSSVYILDEAIKAKNENVYDYIWCVFDRDVLVHPPERFMQLYKQAKNKDIWFAESFPCFEIWFLIHFVLPSSVCHTQEGVLRELKKHITDYCKEKSWLDRKHIYDFLKIYQADAVSHARILDNPSAADQDTVLKTTVHTLIEQVLAYSS